MNTVYGPVSSWRLGKSLGVDLICSNDKICSFDCVYCQLGKTIEKTIKRREFVEVDKIKSDLKSALKKTKPDVITLAGTGEPTLATNIGDTIDAIRNLTDVPMAILTNSSLLNDKDVRKDLQKLDVVCLKMDAHNNELLKIVNSPSKEIKFDQIFEGAKIFSKEYEGKLTVQSMFIESNMKYAKEIADIVKKLNPDEVQINTPLRPCSVKPLNKNQISKIEQEFKNQNLATISVYESKKPKTSPLDKMNILRRRGIEK